MDTQKRHDGDFGQAGRVVGVGGRIVARIARISMPMMTGTMVVMADAMLHCRQHR